MVLKIQVNECTQSIRFCLFQNENTPKISDKRIRDFDIEPVETWIRANSLFWIAHIFSIFQQLLPYLQVVQS